MIISASYKTDIPTFYGDWFIQRLRAGYCKTLNPYNQTISRVDLRREYVDGIVFWTKNIGPFMERLDVVHEMGYPFVVQQTINGYPRALESAVTDASRSTEHVRRIAERFGSRVTVWRYDTIVFSSITPADFHRENFSKLARGLEGAVDEVVISFAHYYDKTKRNMSNAAVEHSFTFVDPGMEEKRELLHDLVPIAQACGMRLTLCSQPELLVPGAAEARCVDAERLIALSGQSIDARLKGNRKTCGCFESKDIGEYDTCPHGCVYCYAVRNNGLAKRRYSEHDPSSEFLFEPPAGAREVSRRAPSQLPLLP